jgi:ferredoxin-nitrite reductase
VDNVRNITGSPLAGLDPDELIDTRGLCREVQDMITNNGEGNPAFTNLPRKFNIAIAGCRENSVHAELNDLPLSPLIRAQGNRSWGLMSLSVGCFLPKRYEAAVSLNAWVPPEDVVALSEAILLVYRNNGLRANRQSRG